MRTAKVIPLNFQAANCEPKFEPERVEQIRKQIVELTEARKAFKLIGLNLELKARPTRHMHAVKTYEEIGEELGLHRSRVQAIEKSALEKLAAEQIALYVFWSEIDTD